ncbi:MAG: hypothetical protein V2B18_24440 [Pseudomonadota bacterium]
MRHYPQRTIEKPNRRPAWLLACLMLFCCDVCNAQSWGSSGTFDFLESYVGPLLPQGGLAASFRSEMGMGLFAAQIGKAELKGSGTRSIDLLGSMDWTEFAYRLDAYANWRFWRLGLRAKYSYTDLRNTKGDEGKLDWSNAVIGIDADVVALEWFTLGVGGDYYLLEPRLTGRVQIDPTVPGPGDFTIDLKTGRSITLGPYFRYTPPEILGFPIALEGYWKLPVGGTRLTMVGGTVAFRPQIYRFDMSFKVTYEMAFYTFVGGAAEALFSSVPGVTPNQNFDLNLEWDFKGAYWTLYF